MPPVTRSQNKNNKRNYKKAPITGAKRRESVITLNISTLPVDKNQKYILNQYPGIVAETLISKYSVCFVYLEFRINGVFCNFSNIAQLYRDISNCQSRYLVVYLRLIDSTRGKSHVNYMIVDNEKKVAERYEPHHLHIWGQYQNLSIIADHLFENFFKYFFPGTKYLNPIDYCFNFPKGFQTQYDKEMVGNEYYTGLCALFALLYLEYRLEYPTIERTKLLQLLDTKLKTLYNAGKLYDYLRQFAQRYENIAIEALRGGQIRSHRPPRSTHEDLLYSRDYDWFKGGGVWWSSDEILSKFVDALNKNNKTM